MFGTLFPNYKTHGEQAASACRSDSRDAAASPRVPPAALSELDLPLKPPRIPPKLPSAGAVRNGEVGAGGTVVSSWQLPAFDLHKRKEGGGGREWI